MSTLPYMYGILVMYGILTMKRMLEMASIPRSPKARNRGHPAPRPEKPTSEIEEDEDDSKASLALDEEG